MTFQQHQIASQLSYEVFVSEVVYLKKHATQACYAETFHRSASLNLDILKNVIHSVIFIHSIFTTAKNFT